MQSLIDALDKLQENLGRNLELNVRYTPFRLHLPDKYDIENFKELNPGHVAIAEIYTLFGNEGLAWKTKDKGDNFIAGEFYLGSIRSTSRDINETGQRDDLLTRCNGGFSEEDSFALIESHPEAGNGLNFVMRFIPGKYELEDIEIWGHDTLSSNVYRLNVTVPQYILAMCHFKCIYNWQWLFVIDEHKDRLWDKGFNQLPQKLQILKRYFPEVDITKRDF